MHFIQSSGHTRNARLLAAADVRAGMADQIRNAQHHAAGEFFDEEIDALTPERIIRRREIDQVTVMADGMLELQPVAVRLPISHRGWIERPDLPLLLVFGENLHGVERKAFGFEKGIVHAAGDGEVGTEHW